MEEIIRNFEREREASRDLTRRHRDTTRDAHRRDRQILIERRKHAR